MTPWMRKLHKWVGLLIALQFVVWTGTGVIMSRLDRQALLGQVHQPPPPSSRAAWPGDLLPPGQVLAQASGPVRSIESAWLQGKPVYHLANDHRRWLVDADTGAPVTIDAETALAVARNGYTGPGQSHEAERLQAVPHEVQLLELPLWRIRFADEQDTTLYVSGQDGRIVARRTATWRLHNFIWNLHMMDYSFDRDFNNPQVVMMGAMGLWVALSGFWLLIVSLHWREFVPAGWRSRRNLTLFNSDGAQLHGLSAHTGDSVFRALGRQGLHLPSNCGGGQSCGLCVVRVFEPPEPSSADRAHLSEEQLDAGYRLSCNLAIDRHYDIEVANGDELWNSHRARVRSVNPVTPFLREVVLVPEANLPRTFRPGAYMQLHVPDYRLGLHDLDHPPAHSDDWKGLGLPQAIYNTEAVRRAYSLAMPANMADSGLTLLVRFSPGRPEAGDFPPGKGSTYLYSLKPGDLVEFNGPFGDFALQPGEREKVFIGGGAGMAPLRAMIHARLDDGGKEPLHFWYGARSLRDAPYVAEMDDLAKRNPNFDWHLVLSGERQTVGISSHGLVHEAVDELFLQHHPDLHHCEFYVCGPPAMLAATRSLLRRAGVRESMVAYDDFKI